MVPQLCHDGYVGRVHLEVWLAAELMRLLDHADRCDAV